jgi:hypothetical protein
MKTGLLVVALMVTVLLSALPAAGQDAVKAEIRQAIDAAYLNAVYNGIDVKAYLAGWDHGAIRPYLIPAIGGRADAVTGEVTYGGVMEIHAAIVNQKPPEKKDYKFLYPAIDVTGDMGLAQVEVVRGEKMWSTEYIPVIKTKTGWKIVGYIEHHHENGARPQTQAGEADAVKKVVEDALVRGLIQDGTKEQVRAGIASVCDTRLYLPEIDVVTRLDLGLVFLAKLRAGDRGVKPLPIRTSAFTLIGITGEAAAGKLAVTFDSGTVITMYVALLKLKTGWAIVEIVTDKDLMRSIFPRPPRAPQRLQ